jgi:phytoene dehydrogenase-like protein
VLEARDRVGGALGTESLTGLDGFHHDIGAAFITFATTSPAFRGLDIPWRPRADRERAPGTRRELRVITRGPTPDGLPMPRGGTRFATGTRGSSRDSSKPCWSLSELGPALALGPANWIRLAAAFAQTGSGVARRWFRTEASRRAMPSLALHVDAGRTISSARRSGSCSGCRR